VWRKRRKASNKSQTEGKEKRPGNASVYKNKTQGTDKEKLKDKLKRNPEMYLALFFLI
jgi:hypothetical protein